MTTPENASYVRPSMLASPRFTEDRFRTSKTKEADMTRGERNLNRIGREHADWLIERWQLIENAIGKDVLNLRGPDGQHHLNRSHIIRDELAREHGIDVSASCVHFATKYALKQRTS